MSQTTLVDASGPAAAAAKPLPGRYGLPLIGETLALLRDPFAFMLERRRLHGPVFKTSIVGTKVACFVGPEAFKTFMDPELFTRDGASPPGLRALLGDGVVPFLEGKAHAARKGILLAAVSGAAVGRYVPVLERIVAARLEALAARGHELRLLDEIAALAFAVMDALFAGASPAADGANADIRAAFDAFNAGVIAPPIRLPFTAFGRALRARVRLVRYFAEAVARHRASPRAASHEDDVMGALIAARDADGKGLTDDEVVLETLHFFFAAYGGMLALLTDLALALATHPEVAARARAEVEAHAAAKGPLTEATLGKLEYLERVCLETKRFYPVVPFTFFARARKDVVFNGCLIPAGMSALGCTHATARDESVFADPERFDPDRFGPERAEHRRHEYAFVAQGGGALTGHRCAGELFSLVVMKVFAAHLLRDYTWALPPQDLSLDMSRIPPTPRDGLRATIRRTPR